MSLSNLIAQTKSFTVGSTEVTVKPFTINEIARLQDWIDGTYQHPLKSALLTTKIADPETRNSLITESKKWTPPQFGTPEADQIMWTMRGMRQVFRVIVTAGDAKLTEADADRIAGEVSLTEFTELLMERMFVAAFGVSEGETDPKAPADPSIGPESLAS